MSNIKKIQNYISENALDAFLVMTKINRQYVSGFTGSAGVVLINKKGGELFVDDRYIIRAKRESNLTVYLLDKLATSPFPLRNRRGGNPQVGIEDRITIRELAWLKKTLKARFVPTKDVVENLRAVKTAQEIKYITKAQKIVDEIFKRVLKLLKSHPSLTLPINPDGTVGVKGREREPLTEALLALEMERYAKKLGAQGMAFDSIVAFGANAAAPHHLSSNKKISRNNFLLLDFGVMVGGYHSDFTRTLFIGKPNKKQKKVYNIVLEAQARAIREIKEGVKASHIDDIARRFIDQNGFGKYFTHNTGHGVGLEIHELPNFSAKSEDVLQKNMIVTVEPGVYIEKWGGVRIEDMVVVTDKGGKLLSKSSKDLRKMIIKS